MHESESQNIVEPPQRGTKGSEQESVPWLVVAQNTMFPKPRLERQNPSVEITGLDPWCISKLRAAASLIDFHRKGDSMVFNWNWKTLCISREIAMRFALGDSRVRNRQA
jgi:hypothetical protein